MGYLRVLKSVRYVVAVVGLVALSAVPALASGGTTLPDPGVDVAGMVTAFGTKIGTFLTVVVGLYFSFLAIRFAMKWSRRAA